MSRAGWVGNQGSNARFSAVCSVWVRCCYVPLDSSSWMMRGDLPARRFLYTLENMARAATSTVMYATGTTSEVAIMITVLNLARKGR